VGFAGRLAVGLAIASALVGASAAPGAVPSNPNDPCVQGTTNICNTTGVGYYRTYRYGTRWFGDFKNAIPGSSHTYCIDLRFWYPGADYRYKEDTSTALRNKAGEQIPLVNQQRIAYAVWQYGRSSDPDQSAAVMLYVHGLMGDARPGEVSPSALGGDVPAIYERVAKDAARLHGPYRVEVSMPETLRVGRAVTATVRVLAAGGAALPDQALNLSAQGASGAPAQTRTDANGVAALTVTPTGGPVKLSASAPGLPSTLPHVYTPTAGAAAKNGQRLVLPSAQTVSGVETGLASKTQIQVSSTATPSVLLVGATSRDRVTISNASGNWGGTVQVRVYGPSRTADAITCAGSPAATTTFTAKGNGSYTTPPVTLKAPGWFVYQEVVPGNVGTTGLTTPCAAPGERFRVQTQPTVVTTVSSQSVAPDAQITDTVKVTGLAGESATVQAQLYGPFATRAVIRCTGTPAWTGSISAAGDGTYVTQAFTVTTPGYYTYRESIAASGFVRATTTTCAEVAETTVVTGTPKVATRVSAQATRPGATITDKVLVTGLGALRAEVKLELWGPFPTRGDIRCTGTPAWRGTVVATGDGTFTSAPVKIGAAGYYTYHESIVDTPAYGGFNGVCGETAETTISRASPTVVTQVTDEVARPGASISDQVKVQGLGTTAAKIEVTLYGPFAVRTVIGCKGTPVGTTSFTARGDGTYTSPGVKVARAGFYLFREHLVGSGVVNDVLGSCTAESEVSLAAPLIITGRGDVTREVRGRARTARLAPRRVTIGSIGIDATSSGVGIDTAAGILGVSPNIQHTGWWVDGAQPGDRAGAVLIAGHVDKAGVGPGAFFHLKNAKPGDKVELTAAGGRTFAYKVVSVKSYLKQQLPADVWSRRGPARLVLVTCGGPFDRKARHYRDNVVLTAVPV
jgi:sortase family protein